MHVGVCSGIFNIQYTGTTGAAESLVVGEVYRVFMADEGDLLIFNCQSEVEGKV